jgi:hypothetical protein
MVTMIENDLAPGSKVWVYQSVRQFTPGEAQTLRNKLKNFVAEWTSHKVGVIGDGDVLFDRFVVLMADEDKVGVSGCSIDSSVHFVKALEHEYRTSFFDRWNIAYFKNKEIVSCHRNEFEKLVDEGLVKDDTIVFNNLVHTKADFESKWQIPYAQSWLKNLRTAGVSFSSIL